MSRTQRRTPRILVVDDDPGLLRLLTIRLRSEKYEVEPVESAARALAAIYRARPDLVITDLRMAEMDGIALLKELRRRWPSLNVIVLTAHGTIPDAVRATQSGAFAFLTKPVEKEQLLSEVRRALQSSGVVGGSGDDWRAEFATRNPLMDDRLAQARLLADSDSNVLIMGKPGTGKELLARLMHRNSSRSGAKLVTVDCGALEDSASEAQLQLDMDAAANGTLYLRGAEELPSRLLPALEQEFRRRDIRIIAGMDQTALESADLPSAIAGLMDRLQAIQIDLPSLADRREDLPLLIAGCLDEIAKETGKPARTCSPEAMELIARWRWPGNIRELRTVLRQAAASGTGPIITAEEIQSARGQVSELPSFDEARDEFTRNYLLQLLRIAEGNVSQAARLAKRNRTDFYKLLTRHGLRPEEYKP